jgi:hypothetical protein
MPGTGYSNSRSQASAGPARTHRGLAELGPNIRATATAGLADEAIFNIGQPHFIRPAIGEGGCRVAQQAARTLASRNSEIVRTIRGRMDAEQRERAAS